ncbi:MAG TPA: tyrosine-type recombinase/integrase [Syntrophales bacterium]|nr:tyrosine-type recombinase/integrase [Syntrophales bacterium]
MSVYSVRGKGWRYDFTLRGIRYTDAWFRTKSDAKQAAAKRKEDILSPKATIETPTDMGFLELVNRRLDHVKAYNSESHYMEHIGLARRWIRRWSKLKCSDLKVDEIERFVVERRKVSAYTANKEIRYLRALFNFGIKREWTAKNPTANIPFLPVEKKIKYIPSKEDVMRVILAADPAIQNYLWTVRETMGRISEINRLTWQDVDFDGRYVVLYTRKKRGGHLTPRKVPMTGRLYDVLSHMYKQRDVTKPWVFWRRQWNRKKREWTEGPYKMRTKIMETLCRKAGVRYFRYHAIRHFGASTLDSANVNVGSIQRILGHENRTTTEIYLHSVGESERKAMEIFERVTNFSHTDSHTELRREKSDFVSY